MMNNLEKLHNAEKHLELKMTKLKNYCSKLDPSLVKNYPLTSVILSLICKRFHEYELITFNTPKNLTNLKMNNFEYIKYPNTLLLF